MGPDQVAALLGREGARERAGETAPACGLTLVRVELGRAAGLTDREAGHGDGEAPRLGASGGDQGDADD
jgi:hypothetical protein